MKDPSGLSRRYLSTPETARILRISNRTLEKYRYKGIGPVFLKLGGRVIYAQEDLDDWLARSARRSTSDYRKPGKAGDWAK